MHGYTVYAGGGTCHAYRVTGGLTSPPAATIGLSPGPTAIAVTWNRVDFSEGLGLGLGLGFGLGLGR